MSACTYQTESVEAFKSQAGALLREHYLEIAHYKDIELDPDFEAYEAAERAGCVRVYTCRDIAGELVGYAVFFVRPNMHYRGSLQAVQDVLYVARAHRYGMAGVHLIKYAEQSLRAEGVQVVYHHVKRTNKVGQLLERLGYQAVDMIYAKRLDRKE